MPRLPRKVARRHSGTKPVTRPSPVPEVPRLPLKTKVDVISTTPATQNEGGCHQVPHLPRETKVDVTKCHACHAKVRRRQSRPRGPKRVPRPSPLPQVPRLPRKTKVDVTKCHACHVKRRRMSPSATPATQSSAAPQRDQARHQTQPSPRSTTPATQNEGGCHKYHTCHAKRRWMSPSATPAT